MKCTLLVLREQIPGGKGGLGQPIGVELGIKEP
jgi:hypothetical protein